MGNLKDYFIFHIPHSSKIIPDYSGFDESMIEHEIELLTDHATDKIFDIDGVDKIIFPYSRLFCDVERLDDEFEPMFKHGRGFYYTKTDNGNHLRDFNEEHKEIVKNEYYYVHHEELSLMVKHKLDKFGVVYIVDCHSFQNDALNTDVDKTENRPDICIGTDDIHTPKWMENHFEGFFKKNNMSVKINSPYSGTIVPAEFIGNKNVKSIMIEINKNQYIDINGIMENKVDYLNQLINQLLFG
jgi:N-formylglutamate amidohydrolase